MRGFSLLHAGCLARCCVGTCQTRAYQTRAGNVGGPDKDYMCPSKYMDTWTHKFRGAGPSDCPPRSVVLSDGVVAEEMARRRYLTLASELKDSQEKLWGLLHEMGNTTSLQDAGDAQMGEELRRLTAAVVPLRQKWAQAEVDVREAQKGEARTFSMGFSQGLKLGERLQAEKAGYLKGMMQAVHALSAQVGTRSDTLDSHAIWAASYLIAPYRTARHRNGTGTHRTHDTTTLPQPHRLDYRARCRPSASRRRSNSL